MHPEIVQDGPGACPICGMALEPRTMTKDEPENPELRDMTRRLWIAAALSAPLLVLAMSGMFGGLPWSMRDADARRARARDARLPLVRVAVLRARGRLGADRPSEHVHAHRAGRGGVVRLQPGRGARARRLSRVTARCHGRRAGLLRSVRRHRHADSRRAGAGASRARADERRAARAARARAEDGAANSCGRSGGAICRSSTCRWAIACASGRASACPSTASCSRARRPLTSRW